MFFFEQVTEQQHVENLIGRVGVMKDIALDNKKNLSFSSYN
ncbi:Uncharacterised protein [Veillonella rodentium]|uniref:Uncharacterized protein n=2 Tax=Veillonella rodentium TaxID=248315 RepID=A0A239ZT94_9FIRM|nr:Uncharacterised protein [Veillonella rodentium]